MEPGQPQLCSPPMTEVNMRNLMRSSGKVGGLGVPAQGETASAPLPGPEASQTGSSGFKEFLNLEDSCLPVGARNHRSPFSLISI